MPTIPDEYRQAMDERYRESERRMRELAGKQQALQSRALRSQGAQKGFTGARNAGAELGVLGNIGAQTSAEVIQKARELESQRLAEMQKWMEGERGYEQELGKMEKGYGYQRGLQQMKQDFEGQQNALNRALQEELTRGGWTEEANRLQMQLDANEQQWTSELAWQQEEGRGKLRLSEQELEQQAAQHAAEMGLNWAQLSEQEKARLMEDTREREMQAADIASREGMQQAQITQEQWMQQKQAELAEQGWDREAARQQAALEWERQKMYGLDYGAPPPAGGGEMPMDILGGGGGGGQQFGGMYGLEQQKLQLEQDRMEHETYLKRMGISAAEAAQMADQEHQKKLAEMGFTHESEMAELNADLAQQVEEFKANQGQLAGIMQQYSDLIAQKVNDVSGDLPSGRMNYVINNLNQQLAQHYGFDNVQDWIDNGGQPLAEWNR